MRGWSWNAAGDSVCAMEPGVAADRESGRVAAPNRLRLRLLAGVVIPVATYVALRVTLHSDTAALAITELLPVAWVLAVGFRRGRVDPIAVIAAIVLGVALAVSVAMGGSSLPLKLRRSVVTGSLGLACLVSVIVRRPLLPVAIGLLARGWPQSTRLARAVGGNAAPSKWPVLTTIIGVTLLCDAAAQFTLAVSVSTATFVGTSRLARMALFALGLGLCGLYLRRTSARHATIQESAPDHHAPVAAGQAASPVAVSQTE